MDATHGIPAAVLIRYRKVCAMRDSPNENEAAVAGKLARKLERKHPKIAQVVEREAQYQDLYDEVREDMAGGVPHPDKVEPPDSATWAGMLRNMASRVTGRDPVEWMAARMEKAVRDHVRYLAEHELDLDFDTFMQGHTLMGIYEQLTAHCAVEIQDGTDEKGKDFYIFEIEISCKLFDRISEDADGGEQFWRFLKACVDEDED